MSMPERDHPLPLSGRGMAMPKAFSLSRWFLRRLLARITIGRLTVVMPDGEHLSGGQSLDGPQAVLILKTWEPLRRLLISGDIGFAESYRDGAFTTPDLTALLEVGARNGAPLRTMLLGAWPIRAIQRLRHLMNANTRAGSQRNITAHYDLGNAFYSQWLDRSMMYSSALYETPGETLEAAQARRLDRIVAMLGVQPGDHVLEIGFGWGGLAERLARQGCRVTGITLSPAQLDYAQKRVQAAGLGERVTLQLQDYRDVAGRYDRVVSIEMIEAVGRPYWPSYFDTLRRATKPGGRAVLQAITIEEALFEPYQQATDFIQAYIFPGGCLPSAAAIRSQATAAGLEVTEALTFGASYALTLKEWRRRFHERWSEIAALGFDERFRRLWDYYLSYCEAGFRAGTIDVELVALETR